MECRGSSGSSGLASRMLGHGARASRPTADRHSLRWHRSHLPAPRKRNRPKRGSHRSTVLPFLGPRGISHRRQREDVEIAGEYVHDSRHHRAWVPAIRGPVFATLRVLSQAAQLHVGESWPCGRGAAALDGLSGANGGDCCRGRASGHRQRAWTRRRRRSRPRCCRT